MKYSIMGLSQENLLLLGLDTTDALIIRWFLDFEPFMAKTLYNNEAYGWVSINKIYQDIPIIKVKERALRARIDNLVKIGVFKKYLKNTQQGKKLYLKAGDAASKLLNKNDLLLETKKIIKDIICNSKDDINKEIEDREIYLQHTKTAVADTNVITNQQTAVAEFAVTQHTKTAVADQEMSQTAVAQYTKTAVALNDNPISDKPITNSAAYNLINLISNTSDSVFGPKYFAFDFPNKAAAFFKAQGFNVSLLNDYFVFVKEKVQNKQNVENPKALTFRLILAQDIVTEFLRHNEDIKSIELQKQKKIEAAEKMKVICPACQTKFNPNEDYCPICGLFIKDFSDAKAIKYRQMYVRLPDSLKLSYETDIKNFLTQQYSTGFLGFTSPEARQKRYEKEYELIEKYSRMAG